MSFTITLTPSGKSFRCASDSELLKAGLDQGIALRYSCRSGVCRTCRARRTAGDVDHGPVNPNYLSEAEKREGWVHLCCARPLSDCVFEAAEIDIRLTPARTFPVRVLQANRLAADVMQLILGLPPNEPLRFSPGQYVDILLPDGARRSYSIATAPTIEGVRQVELHIRHMPGGRFTDHVFDALKLRDLQRVEAPQGSFFLDEASTRPMILLVSGTGFAPIKSMVEYCIGRNIRRPMHLYWGGRRRPDLYLHTLAGQWAREHSHIRYVPVLSDAGPGCEWHGRTGLVHKAVLEDLPVLSAYQVYACGAPAMVAAARRDFGATAALPDSQFFADAFISQADIARSASA